MLKGNNTISSVMKGSSIINIIKKGLITVYEAFKELIVSGIPPLTLNNSIGKDLVDYKVYGNSVQSRLPAGYKECEYLESTGTQYIITNYVPNYNSKIYFKFTTTKQLSDEFNCLIGSGLVNATNTNWGYSVILESSTSELKFRSYSNTLNSTGKIINQNETHNYILEYGKLTCDDVEYTGNTDLSTGNMSNLYIFARYFKESSSAGISKGKLYNFKVEENSVIKMNLIPCYRKSDNVIGMYDLVNGVFYENAGTGTFNKGNDVIPTPDAPIEIESVGEYDETTGKYKIPVTVRGKNLFDYNTQNWSIGLLISDTGNINTTNANYKTTDFLDILDAQKFYIVSFMQNYNVSTSTSNRICYYDKNKNFIGSATDNKYTEIKRYSYTLDVPSNAAYIRYSIRVTDSDIQIEEGTTATDYEPYYEPITTNIYLNEPLRKVSDYADYIDFEKGKVIRNVQEKTFNGSENWQQGSSMSTRFLLYNINDLKKDVSSNSRINIMSNYFEAISWENRNLITTNSIYTYVASSAMAIAITNNDTNVVSDFKKWLSVNNVKTYYPLETPIEETIELPNIPTFKGTNIIEVDTEIQPSNMAVKYKGLD